MIYGDVLGNESLILVSFSLDDRKDFSLVRRLFDFIVLHTILLKSQRIALSSLSLLLGSRKNKMLQKNAKIHDKLAQMRETKDYKIAKRKCEKLQKSFY
jgi:hypothetical protein